MAVFKSSITTRYDDTFTGDGGGASQRGSSDFASDFGITLANDIFTVNTNQISGGGTNEYVIFNKKFVINDQSRVVNNGQNGHHAWFVNCTFEINGRAPGGSQGDGTPRVGPSNNQGGNTPGTRDDSITGTKSNDTTWNFYGCSFIINTDADNDAAGVFAFGDIVDCDFTLTGDDDDSFRCSPILQPQNNGIINGMVINGQSRQLSVPITMFLWNEPSSLEGIVFNNAIPYVGGGRNENTFVDYFSGVSAQRGSNDVLFVAADEIGINFVNVKCDIAADGSVGWRSGDSTDARLIQRQRIERSYYATLPAQASNGRKDVKLEFDTTCSFSGSDLQTANTSGSSTNQYEYISATDGILEGTANINNRFETVTSQDFESMDLPVQVLSRTTNSSGENYDTDVFNYTNTLSEMSLWGTRFVNSANNKGGSNIVLSAADDDGYFVAPDNEVVVDADDTLMAGLSETIANIDDNLVAATGTISLTDIGQNWKYFVWDTARWDDWSTSHFSGTTLDITGGTAGEIVINPDQTDVVTDNGTAFTFTAPQETDGEVDIVVASGEAVQTLTSDKLSGTNCTLTLQGGNYDVTTVEDLRFTTSTPDADFFTVKDASIDGTLTWAPASGNTQYVVLDNVSVISGGTLTVQNTGAGTLNVIYKGEKPTTTTSNTGGGTLNEQVQKTVTLEGTGAYDSNDIKMRYALTTDGGTPSFTLWEGTNDSTVTAATTNTNDTLITFTTSPTNTDLYYAIAYDEFDLVTSEGAVTTDQTHSMANNFSGDVAWDASTADLNISGGTDWRNTTVGAISSDTADIDVTVTETEGSTLSDRLTRVWLRRYVLESNSWLDALAQDRVSFNFIRLNSGQITLPDDTSGTDDRSRINFTHTSSNNVFKSESRLLSANLENDLFDSTDITSSNVSTRITFAINASGVSLAEVKAELNNRDLTKDNVGNLGLGVPAFQFNEGSLNTTPKVS